MSALSQGSFINDVCCGEPYLMGVAYASLGFVVVAMDMPGMPLRDKAFRDKHYGRILSINGFEDRIAGIRQLAERFSYMDTSRVGIVSYDGATAPAMALLEKPEFYKVGVNVDFEDGRYGIPNTSIIEMYEGERRAERPYDDDLLSALKGKLLLSHGLRNSHSPEMTLQLVEALQTLSRMT